MAKKATSKSIGRPKTRDKDGVEPVTAYLPMKLYDRLEAYRDKVLAERSRLIQRAIEEYLDRMEKELGL